MSNFTGCSCPHNCQLHQPFFDEDLKRLKVIANEPFAMSAIKNDDLKALLARLEAAENAVIMHNDLLGVLEEFTELEWGEEGPPANADEFIEKANETFEAWRKAAGK